MESDCIHICHVDPPQLHPVSFKCDIVMLATIYHENILMYLQLSVLPLIDQKSTYVNVRTMTVSHNDDDSLVVFFTF